MADDAKRTPPPSFSPEGGRSRPGSAGDDPIVVGRDEAPARPPRRSASSAGTRGTGGDAPSFSPSSGSRPAGGQTPRPVAGSGSPARPARPTTSTPASGAPAARRSTDPGSTRVAPAVPSAPRTSRSQAPTVRSAAPGGPGRPGAPGAPSGPPPAPRSRRRRRRTVALVVVLALVVAILAWPIGLVAWANGKIQHTEALSGAANTPGTTYLLTGSDARGDGAVKDDGTKGARTDSILVLHVPESGPTALVSIPRDTYVEDIPGHGPGKINAAFAYGGAPLLVETVEQITGLTVDHYAEVGMAGVRDLVDAVGGVRLCYDRTVKDRDSKLRWKAGCHVADGKTALAFSRMRKSDPLGDIGRAQRQRQVIAKLAGAIEPRSLVLQPAKQVALIDAGTAALTLDESSGIIDLGRLALAFKAANGDGGVTGTPPIKSLDYRPGGVGSTVLLDPDTVGAFWKDVRDGDLEPGDVGGID